jgi:hypothetical protein
VAPSPTKASVDVVANRPTKEQLRVKLIMSEVEDEEDKRGRVGEG